MPWKISLAFALIAITGIAQPVRILVDTDAGTDDLMAIAFLLAQPTARIDAITVVNGLAHVDAGANNVTRLLALGGRGDVPVFAGRAEPIRGNAEFPAEWRKISDELPGVTLPPAQRRPETRPAVDYLIERLRQADRPVRILALGPLTNLAEVIKRAPASVNAVAEIVVMGGAIHAPGNLADGGLFKTSNASAEWNMFIDPLAAQIVFRSGVKIRLIPLDATNMVPIGVEFLRDIESGARSPLGRFVAQVLKSDRDMIEQKLFYAWDPLAAAALIDPRIVQTVPTHVEIRRDSPQQGRTVGSAGRPNARVGLRADAEAFKQVFLDAFAH